MDKIRLAGIVNDSIVNGEGIRTVYFSQGCTHNCKGCFNKDTHSFKGGKLFNIDDLVNDAKRNPIIDGVTFSGGDPFQQADKFKIFAKKLKENNINIWSYTGYTIEEIKNSGDKDKLELLSYIDVLVDGKFIKELQNDEIRYRGSSNQRIIKLKDGEII